MPFARKDIPDGDQSGQAQPEIQTRWLANSALNMGDKDGGVPTLTKLHEVLDSYGIANQFELFEGPHTSRVAFRFQEHVLPLFSKNLCLTADCR